MLACPALPGESLRGHHAPPSASCSGIRSARPHGVRRVSLAGQRTDRPGNDVPGSEPSPAQARTGYGYPILRNEPAVPPSEPCAPRGQNAPRPQRNPDRSHLSKPDRPRCHAASAAGARFRAEPRKIIQPNGPAACPGTGSSLRGRQAAGEPGEQPDRAASRWPGHRLRHPVTVPLCVVLVRPRRPGKAVEHDERDGADDRDEADEPPEPALAGVVQPPDRQADGRDGD